MTEDYLQYAWKLSRFTSFKFITTEGETVEILSKGIHNHNAGPDFLDTRIKIGQTLWAGNVEIHVQSGDWNKHKHHQDPAYDNVILHAVYEDNKSIKNTKGAAIPTLELKPHIDHDHYFEYEHFLTQKQPILCSKSLQNSNRLIWINWMDRMLIQRLENKTTIILNELNKTQGNWEEVFHRTILRYFGMKINGDAFYDLACKLPLAVLKKEVTTITNAEALLFGQAGFLDKEREDIYYTKLRKEYLYQKQKHKLSAIQLMQWRFAKLRPPNFPTIRLAQIAAIYHQSYNLFQFIRDKETVKTVKQALTAEVSSYWHKHYRFAVKSNGALPVKSKVGNALLDTLIINCFVPMAFSYGKSIGDTTYLEYAEQLLEEIKFEQNKITKLWLDMPVDNATAKDSQAILQLQNNYCDKKQCLNCQVGVAILR